MDVERIEAKMSDEEFDAEIATIKGMTQFEMARLNRYAPLGHKYFNTYDYPKLTLYFTENFLSKGGMTPEISKRLGWRK